MKTKYYLEDYPYLCHSIGREAAESIKAQVATLEYDTDFPPAVDSKIDMGTFVLKVLQGPKANKRTIKVYKFKR